jgi:hypothetical protein
MAYARTSNEWAITRQETHILGQRAVNVRGLGSTRTLQEGGVRKSDAGQLARRGPKPNRPKKKRQTKVAPIAPIRNAQAAIGMAWQDGDAEKVLRLYPRALSAARKGRQDGVGIDGAKVTAIRLWARQ